MQDTLIHGLWPFGGGWAVALFLLLTQITIFSVTLYLHRAQAHRALDLHPVVSHFFRFWLWMTTGMNTREWVAVHRKHHAHCETENDPHSPVTHGIWKVLFHGVSLYTEEAKNPETIEKYGRGTPNDWLQRHLYDRWRYLGIALMAVIDLALFGPIGLTFWAGQILWIPFWAAGVINGAGHWWGYRNFITQDTATNLIPIAFFIGGEELHNNHHAFPSSARFSMKRWELDLGWQCIRLLRALGLARVLREAPRLSRERSDARLDEQTLKALFLHRFTVMTDYYRQVIIPVLQDEARQHRISVRRVLRKGRRLMRAERRFLNRKADATLQHWLEHWQQLKTVHEHRQRLLSLWERHTTQPEQLLQQLKHWCEEAERSGIAALQNFARQLRSYQLQPA